MEPLAYNDLSTEEKIYLGSLTKHPGFVVLKKLMEDASRQATALVIKLDPEDPQYDIKLRGRQLIARTVNDVCATLIKSIMMHSSAGELEEKIQQIEPELEEASFGSGLGSIRKKSRREEQ